MAILAMHRDTGKMPVPRRLGQRRWPVARWRSTGSQ